MAPWRFALIALVLAACGPKPAAPVAFVDSPAFSDVERRAYGVLKGDDAAVVVEKTEAGYRALAFARDENGGWAQRCTGGELRGEDLDVMRWVSVRGGRLLLVASTTATPDAVEQHLELLHVEEGCASRHNERLRLPRPGPVVGPGTVPSGITVLPGEEGVRLVDEPQLVKLRGAKGDVSVLTGVRARVLSGTPSALEVTERKLGFLRPRKLTAQWRAPLPDAEQSALNEPAPHEPPKESPNKPGPEPDSQPSAEPRPDTDPHQDPDCPPDTDCTPSDRVDLPELQDTNGHTTFAIRANEAGTLILEADGPLRLLEIWHGCPHQPAIPLELHLGRKVFTTGEPPSADSFVQGAGRSKVLDDGSARELLALLDEAQRLELDLAAAPSERCIRQIKGYGFDAHAAPKAEPSSTLPNP